MNQQDLNNYASLMSEVRFRVQVLKAFLSGEANTVYVRTNTESMCLQFRKILELIAFSSLVAHRAEYSKVRQKFATDWHGKRILEEVEKINPFFFPRPVRGWTKTRLGKSVFNRVRSGYLSRTQFARLYDQCGGMLHSKNPFSKERSFVKFSNRMPEWLQRIETLLIEHIVLLDGQIEILWVNVPPNLGEPVKVLRLEKAGLGLF